MQRDYHRMLACVLLLAACVAPPVRGQIMSASDFESPVGTEWTNRLVNRSPSGRGILGLFTKETIGLSLANLPAHGAIRVTFDLYVVGNWDGTDATNGLDVFDLRVRGGATLAHTTFSNGPATQNYPDPTPGTVFAARSGATELNVLGYSGLSDSVYHLTYTFPHVDGRILLNFSALNLDFRDQEYWALDNVVVSALPSLGSERVYDGDFEVPDVPTEFTLITAPSAIKSWAVTVGSVDLTAGYWEAFSGKQSVDMTGTSRGIISQSVPTAPGQPYVLRFAIAGHPLGPPAETPAIKQLEVYWAGTKVGTLSFDITGRTTYDMGWRYHQFDVVGPALASSASLEFRSLTDGFYGPVIDGVSVVAGTVAGVLGDLNADGRADLLDAVIGDRALRGLGPSPAIAASLADVAPWIGVNGRLHGDGIFNAEDVRILQKLAAGLTP